MTYTVYAAYALVTLVTSGAVFLYYRVIWYQLLLYIFLFFTGGGNKYIG